MLNCPDLQPIQDLEERYYTLSTVRGGMGEVRIAFDRHIGPGMLNTASQLLNKCRGLSPANIKAEGPLAICDNDRLKITIHIALGLINTARNLRNDAMAAIKLIRADLSTKRAIDSFRYEARLWLEIARHPNIVKLREIIKLPNRLALILEYVDGGTLRDLISMGKPLGLPRALEIAADICNGMDYLHSSLGILHRDLKPENVLMSFDGTAMIADFGLGLAKYTIGVGASPSHGGTPAYMPPEQIDNPTTVDERADIFSFGVVLFEMLNGQRGYQERVDHATLRNAPPQLQELVIRCLDRDRQNRPDSFREIRAYLHDIVNSMNLTFPLSPSPELSWESALLAGATKL